MKLIKVEKERSIYALDDNHLLIETSDKTSAFGKVLPGKIANMGLISNRMAINWLLLLEEELFTSNNLVSYLPEDLRHVGVPEASINRSVVVKHVNIFPFECIVRGFYISSASSWNLYREECAIAGIELPSVLKEAEQLPKPIFTPSMKISERKYDKNITFEEMEIQLSNFLKTIFPDLPLGARELLAMAYCKELRELSLSIYNYAFEYALEHNIILADTKLEFGINDNGDIILVGECLTPNSSTYWPADTYLIGRPQTSKGKQLLYDYLNKDLGWDGTGEIPEIPTEFYTHMSDIYTDIYTQLFGPLEIDA